MGGWGSGRWRQGKDTTAGVRALDIRRLQRDGLLTAGQSFTWEWSRNGKGISSIQVRVADDKITLTYRTKRNDGHWKEFDYPISLSWTECHLGGRRTWFHCPGQGCGRRVAILYCKTIFACRRCHGLAYASQHQTPDERALQQADKIRKRLGWPAGVATPPGRKPQGMHWKTYNKLIAEYHAYAEASLSEMASRVDLIEERLSQLSKKLA